MYVDPSESLSNILQFTSVVSSLRAGTGIAKIKPYEGVLKDPKRLKLLRAGAENGAVSAFMQVIDSADVSAHLEKHFVKLPCHRLLWIFSRNPGRRHRPAGRGGYRNPIWDEGCECSKI